MWKGCAGGGPAEWVTVSPDEDIRTLLSHQAVWIWGLRLRSSTVRILRKEVIQPQVPLRLPCYDFTPVADLTVVGCVLAVRAPASGKTNSHGVTGGVYKARERIHRGVLIRDY